MKLLDKKFIILLLSFFFLITGCEKEEEKEYVINKDAEMFRKIIEEIDYNKLKFTEDNSNTLKFLEEGYEEDYNLKKVEEIMMNEEDAGSYYGTDFSSNGFSAKKIAVIGTKSCRYNFKPLADEYKIESHKKSNNGSAYQGAEVRVNFKVTRDAKDNIIGNEDDCYEYELVSIVYIPETCLLMSPIVYDVSEKKISNTDVYDLRYSIYSDTEEIKKRTRKKVEKYLGKKTEDLYEYCSAEDAYKLIVALVNESAQKVYRMIY